MYKCSNVQMYKCTSIGLYRTKSTRQPVSTMFVVVIWAVIVFVIAKLSTLTSSCVSTSMSSSTGE